MATLLLQLFRDASYPGLCPMEYPGENIIDRHVSFRCYFRALPLIDPDYINIGRRHLQSRILKISTDKFLTPLIDDVVDGLKPAGSDLSRKMAHLCQSFVVKCRLGQLDIVTSLYLACGVHFSLADALVRRAVRDVQNARTNWGTLSREELFELPLWNESPPAQLPTFDYARLKAEALLLLPEAQPRYRSGTPRKNL